MTGGFAIQLARSTRLVSCSRPAESLGRATSAARGNTLHTELFRREILPKLGTVPLAEIMEAAGCYKASASDYRREKRTPHASTWGMLGRLVGLEILDSAKPSADKSCMDGHR